MNNDTNKPQTGWFKRIAGSFTLTKINILLWGIVAIIVIIAGWYFLRSMSESTVKIDVDNRIDITPTIVTAMKETGEWQFLSVNDEELVDTTKRGFLREEKLVRIYYGKLSLGIDMRKFEPQWVQQQGDTITMTLPEIQLLDNEFIDEARTKAFIETGKWTNADREKLYHKAYNRMMERCMTAENIAAAKGNATEQIEKMLHALGIEHCIIKFSEQN